MKYRAVTCYRGKSIYDSEKLSEFLDNYNYYSESILKNSFFAIQAIEDELENFHRNDSPKYQYNSEEELIKNLNDSRIPVLKLSGEIIIPFEVNYPEKVREEDILIPWNSIIKELWPGEQ